MPILKKIKAVLGRSKPAPAKSPPSRQPDPNFSRDGHREAMHARRRAPLLRKYVRQGGVGAEIGVFWGHFAEYLVRDFQPVKLYLVDPWDLLFGETFPAWSPYTNWGALTTREAMQVALDLAEAHPDVVEVRKEFSTSFLPSLGDASLDWIYLDAAHKYPDVMADLEALLPKMKPDGVILGDDYFTNPDAKHRGVKRAVDEFAGKHGLELIVEDFYQYVLLQKASPRPAGQDES